jgi:glutaredoxin 3
MDQKRVVIYTRNRSLSCWRARRLLRHKGYAFVLDTTRDEELHTRPAQFTGRRTAPYIFIDDRPVGGFGDIKALDYSGDLDRLVLGKV